MGARPKQSRRPSIRAYVDETKLDLHLVDPHHGSWRDDTTFKHTNGSPVTVRVILDGEFFYLSSRQDFGPHGRQEPEGFDKIIMYVSLRQEYNNPEIIDRLPEGLFEGDDGRGGGLTIEVRKHLNGRHNPKNKAVLTIRGRSGNHVRAISRALIHDCASIDELLQREQQRVKQQAR